MSPANAQSGASGPAPETPSLKLRPEHVELLRARAINVAHAEAADLHSVTGEEAAALLGRKAKCGSGLAVPYHGTPDPYARVRIDDPSTANGARYLTPASKPVPVYIPGGGGAANPTRRLVVVEGPLKALALESHGITAVGLGGTGTTLTPKGADQRLNDSWRPVPLKGREIVVLFDSNRRTNPNVARDESRLVCALEKAGATVKLADLPPAPNGDHWGPDDFLAANGPVELPKVIDAAVPAAPLLLAAQVVASGDLRRIAALLDDMPFLVAIVERGSACEQLVRAELKKRGTRAADLDRALDRARRNLRGASSGSAQKSAGLGGTDYQSVEGRLCIVHKTEDGERTTTPLCNFEAEIVEEDRFDDGVEVRLEFVLEGKLSDGTKLPRVRVKPEDLSDPLWPQRVWGARAITTGDPGMVAHLRAAIQERSSPKRRVIYTHTGWRQHSDDPQASPVFLHDGGAVGAEDVGIELDAPLRRYRLPAAVKDPREAVRLSLRLLDVVKHNVAVVLFAAVYRAPLCALLPTDFVLWVFGHTGSLKSTIAGLAVAHFGEEFDTLHHTANFGDTINSIERRLFMAKDVIADIDDFAPKSTASFDETRTKAEAIVRAVGNQASRGRLYSNLEARPDRPPRGLVMVTGEDLPSGQSIIARTLPMQVHPGDVFKGALSEIQAQQGLLSHAMRAYLEWLAPRMAALRGTIRPRFLELRTDFSRGGHLRSPATQAHLAIGIETFAEFARDIGVMGRDSSRNFVNSSFEALRQLGNAQAGTVAATDPARRFLDVLRSLLAEGKVRLEAADRNAELTATAVEPIGWDCGDPEGVYLLPEAVYRAVSLAMRGSVEQISLKPSMLWQRMVDTGDMLPGDEEGRPTVRRALGGRQRMRVLCLRRSALDDGSAPDDPPPGPCSPRERETPETPSETVGPVTEKLGTQSVEVGHSGTDGGAAAPEGEEEILKFKSPSSVPPAPAAGRPGRPSPGRGPPVGPDSPEDEEKDLRTFPGGALSPPGKPGHFGPAEQECLDIKQIRLAQPANGLGHSGPGVGSPEAADGPEAIADPAISAFPTPAYQFIKDAADLPAVAAALAPASLVGLDLETTGLDAVRDRPRLLQLTIQGGETYVIDLFATGGLGEVEPALKAIHAIGHNIQFDVSFLLQHFGVCPASLFDTETASRLIGRSMPRPKGFHTLAAVVQRHLGIKLPKEQQRSDWTGPLSPAQLDYAARDTAVLLPLHDILRAALDAGGLTRAADLEFQLIPVVVAMELAGVGLDLVGWERMVAERSASVTELASEVKKGLQIDNPNSNPQIRTALGRLGIQTKSTNATALAAYASRPEIEALLSYRTEASFVRGAGVSVADASRLHSDRRIRPSLNPMAAPTGRFGCSGPNLMGLPKQIDVRRHIVPAHGYVFIIADYAAIELRVLAQITGDSRLLEIFNSGGDPHRGTAALILGKSIAQVTDVERQRAKAVNFGFCFGMGADRFVEYALSEYGVTVTRAEAAEFRHRYLRAYPGVARWQQEIKARMEPQAVTRLGRVRQFPSRKNGYAERLNTPVQGTAAEGLKLAMVQLHPALAAVGARINLCIHDELLVEAPRDRADEVRKIVEDGMIAGMKVVVPDVPIVVEVSIRSMWWAKDVIPSTDHSVPSKSGNPEDLLADGSRGDSQA